MGNRSRGALMVMTVATALVAAGSCTYAPNFADGTLQCSSDGQCPKGYSCALASNTCSKTGGTTAKGP